MKKVLIVMSLMCLATLAMAQVGNDLNNRRPESTPNAKPAQISPAMKESAKKIAPLLKSIRFAQEEVARVDYPANGQDVERIMDIFQRLVPVMDQYNELRAQVQDPIPLMARRVKDAEFVTRDGRSFKMLEFISQFVGQVSSDKLSGELMEFKDLVQQDMSPVKD